MKPSLILLAFLFAAPGAALAAPAVVDSGSFRISLRDRTVGTERFAYETTGDSLIVRSYVHEVVPSESSADTLEKWMKMVVKAEDYDLRNYESTQRFLGQSVKRGLSMSDTSFTSFFQVNDRGVGNTMVRPPGRIFVADPQVFTLYDVVCRNLHGRTFERRDLTFFSLGLEDTTLYAVATDLGPETIRWASRPVTAREIQIREGSSEYFLWISDKGQMLRLSQPAYGMVIERVGPRVKPASRRRTAG